MAAMCVLSISGCAEAESKPKDPTQATDSNTPHVGPHGSVRVDTLRWKLLLTHAFKTVPTTEDEAKGIYVLVKLSVKNEKTEAATITDSAINLVIGKNIYAVDGAAEYDLDPALAALTVQPSESEKISVAFDVPPSKLNARPELRSSELGFGSTHGYIVLPQPVHTD
jgi:hypothetical protein